MLYMFINKALAIVEELTIVNDFENKSL